MRGEGKNYTGNVNMKTLMNTAMKTIMKSSLCAMVALLFATTGARAADYTWNTDVATGAWSDPANWLVGGESVAVAPGTSDNVDFSGVTATVTISANTAVNKLTGISNNANVTFQTATSGTTYGLSVKTGFPGTVDASGMFTFDGINLYPNYTTLNNDVWGLNENNVTFGSDCTLVAKNGGSVNFGGLSVNNTVHLVAESGGTVWVRKWNTIKGLDLTLDDGKLDGSLNPFKSASNAVITFKGSAPKMQFFKANPTISGTITFHFVLPASPYASGPIVNKAAIDFSPSGSVVFEIDENSPALTSGSKQTYRLVKWDNNAAKGFNQANVTYPTMRTSEEVFSTSSMSGSTSAYPQYVNVVIDGTYDPSAAPLDVTFGTPYPANGAMVFPGNVVNLGSGATQATIALEYGETSDLGSSAVLGTVTTTGAFALPFSGFGDGTYYYRLVVANDKSGTVTTDIGTCSLVCGTELTDTLSLVSVNGVGTASGTFDVFGSGITTLTLWISRDRSDWTVVGTTNYTANPAGGAWTVSGLFPGEGVWYGKVTSSNAYSQQEWSDETAVTDVSVSDSLTYTWKAEVAQGFWTNAANWTCSGTGIGYPTTASTANFPVDGTNSVMLSADTTVASLSVLPAGASITLVGDNVSLIAPNFSATGASATLTLDGVTLADNANFWSSAKSFSPGTNSVLRLRNGAAFKIKGYNPSANFTLDIAGGSSVLLRESNNSNPSAVIVDNSTLEIPDKAFKFSSITFRGTTPTMKVYGLSGAADPTRLIYELPATPYAEAPLRQSAMVPSAKGNLNPGDGKLEVYIPRGCAARTARAKGPFNLVDWSLSASYGMNTNAFVTTTSSGGKLKSAESLDFAWMSGADATSVGPQHLSLALSVGGTVIIVR